MCTVYTDSSKTPIESINLAYFSNFCFNKSSILLSFPAYHGLVIAIYAPVIYTAPCIMFWMCVYLLRGQVGGGWAMDIKSFLDPVKWHRAEWRVSFGAQKNQDFQGPTPFHLPK